MRINHFKTLKPICPRCRLQKNVTSPLQISRVEKSTDNIIFEGLITCSNDDCNGEYPIIYGIPVIVANVREYLKNNFLPITVSENFSSLIESILSDAAGADSEFNNTRHYLSLYGWDHYADKAPVNEFPGEDLPKESGIVNCLNNGLKLLPHKPSGSMIDIGCALGRTTFELASTFPGLALGIDINFWKLRLAQNVLHQGEISFPLKKYGVAYNRHSFEVSFKNKNNVDFWVCNALNLPFNTETFQFASAFNIIDMLPAPKKWLRSLREILTTEGQAIISTPYDWPSSTNIDNWLGGHKAHEINLSDSEQILKNLIINNASHKGIDGLEFIAEILHQPWKLRVHKRHTASYDIHIVACKKTPIDI